MTSRIIGYLLLAMGFTLAMAFVWPGLHGLCIPMVPPQVHRTYEETDESIPRHHHQQAQQELNRLHLEKRRGLLLPLLMMLSGAILLDLANRRTRDPSPDRNVDGTRP